ncbi:redox-sensitive bicupin YhaK (pirin superfamily) [Paenibacillus forsythiae]|uniref:Redox-sensitive bicupin YhaK (Pirin superfamily) n=1 Tax=Paenibacillus forsythiae TaxID=365616 RepID=A0ABU3HCQ6_9BACL|nr:pirin family protein [Paenibacillus forsythiae]MDT3428603.1 redox-sensitive bicupin YhaK (pirin superfamily) [Paenibacillus forsythiae]
MQTMVYTPAMQGRGEFDGGKIKEQKPIGFSGEGSVIKRVGPLFYWAWATSSTEAGIGLHPHQGFEIITYVVQGNAFHGDTLGTDSTVGAGGAQVMQTGSGVSHQERLSAGSELFQIWFEPELTEAVRRKPTYRQYQHEDFPQEVTAGGVSVKTVIGPGAPVQLVADSEMWDVEIGAGARYVQKVPAGYTLTALAIRGQGTWAEPGSPEESVSFQHKDFIKKAVEADAEVEIMNSSDQDMLRLIMIKVPTKVDYPLYPKR